MGKDLFQMLQGKEVHEQEACLQQSIDEELDKPDDQIDFDRLEACVKALHVLRGKRMPLEKDKPLLPERSRKSSRFWKVCMASCMTGFLMLLSVLSSFAFERGIFDRFWEWSGKGWIFRPTTNSEEESRPVHKEEAVLRDLRRQLEEIGCKTPLFPHYRQEKLRVEKAQIAKEADGNWAELAFVIGAVRINQIMYWNDDPSFLPEIRLDGDFDRAEVLEVNGRRYYLLRTDNLTHVYTIAGNVLYNIYLHCSPEMTKEILFTYY